MLFHKTAIMYGYTRDPETNISSYKEIGEPFECNIQPVTTSDGVAMGLEGGTLYNKYRIYTRKTGLKPGDKVSVDGEIYVIKSVSDRKGIRDSFTKIYCDKSNGL